MTATGAGQRAREVAPELRPYQPPRKPEQDIDLKRGPFDPGGQPELSSPNRLLLGLADWNVGEDWSASLRLARDADRIGLDHLHSTPCWTGRGVDSMTGAYASAAATQRILVNLGATAEMHLHPVHVARFAANVDHVADGRCTLSISTRPAGGEHDLFGIDPHEDRERFDVADEFVTVMKHVWSAALPFNLEGDHFTTEHCLVVGPRSSQCPRPLLVYTGYGETDMDFAAKHCDWLVLDRPGASDDELAAAVAEARDVAPVRYGRKLKVLGLARVRTGETDGAAVNGRSGPAGALKLVGCYDTVTERLAALSRDVGMDGLTLSFDDPMRGLHALEDELIPRLVTAGLRSPVTA